MPSLLAPRHAVLIARGKQAAKQIYNALRTLAKPPSRSLQLVQRNAAARLAELPTGPVLIGGTVLIDGSFDNPNYWWRLALFLAASGRPSAVGVLGKHQRASCSAMLAALGVSDLADFGAAATMEHCGMARDLLRSCTKHADILSWQLPEDFPAATLYDHILKRQRGACVRLDDPLIEEHVADVLAAIAAARRWVNDRSPAMIVLSHAITPLGAALAWVAQRRGIPSVVLFGNYGTPRFWRIDVPEDFFRCMDCPSGEDLDSLPLAVADRLAQIGALYLDKRLAGETSDLATKYAFTRGDHPDRTELAKRFGWTENKPVVVVYAANWFDYPHAAGMTQFTDFLDWIEVTRTLAVANQDVYWLFRAHPVDAWYGGLTLGDVLPEKIAPHVQLCPANWSGRAVTAFADALVTYHGTAAIEYAVQGKPVLVADRGWYHDCGFVFWPRSRADYVTALSQPWWLEIDRETAKRRAQVFAGWYFCVPDWQMDMVLPDDSLQANLYPALTALLTHNLAGISREILEIGDWLRAKERFYHTFKMRRADAYALSNLA